jgi:hypothetical protein
MDEVGNLVSDIWLDECDDYVSLNGKVNVEINGETRILYAETGVIK